ncbi:metallo-beta-lactamase superfamily protein [Proteus hauseri ATCC 700826]|uniref:Metallo-beta-lactamase superfamily protein n=1 Tax=Proteus hauseri ATCC 700826 TaxID=1354271 RepID=A0AAJ3LUC1_PROHU|nr:MBL fold metallo-hydrolase [Proteus hauseri]OAT48273.1 metallo-beta-lactamase superfamily protein [Proteus hauseri ATCC 700826]
MKKLIPLALATTTLFATSAIATELTIDIYNPGEASVFPVSSEIIYGNKDVVLIDAQFQKNDAQVLVDKIKASGKNLSYIYISHSDPDFYFGLDVITHAFPNAKVIASAPTIKAINETQAGKLAYWGPVLKENAPEKIIIPEVVTGDSFSIEGEKIYIKGLDGQSPNRTYLYIPKLNAVMGGVLLSENIHVWLADTQSKAERQHWITSLQQIKTLSPKTVIPGHYLPTANYDMRAVDFTINYLKEAEAKLTVTKNSDEFITAMDKSYPNLADKSSLELSAKVLKGEMQWPQ